MDSHSTACRTALLIKLLLLLDIAIASSNKWQIMTRVPWWIAVLATALACTADLHPAHAAMSAEAVTLLGDVEFSCGAEFADALARRQNQRGNTRTYDHAIHREYMRFAYHIPTVSSCVRTVRRMCRVQGDNANDAPLFFRLEPWSMAAVAELAIDCPVGVELRTADRGSATQVLAGIEHSFGGKRLRSLNVVLVDGAGDKLPREARHGLVQLIGDAPHLQRFEMYGVRFGENDDSFSALATSLARNPALKELSITRSSFQDAGLHALTRAFSHRTDLQVLELSMNDVSVAGAVGSSLVPWIEHNKSLRRVLFEEMSGGYDQQLEASMRSVYTSIAQAVKDHPQLTNERELWELAVYAHLDDNDDVSEDDVFYRPNEDEFDGDGDDDDELFK